MCHHVADSVNAVLMFILFDLSLLHESYTNFWPLTKKVTLLQKQIYAHICASSAALTDLYNDSDC